MIPDGAPGGLCPACVLTGSQAQPTAAGAVPSLEQIAGAFPELEVAGLIGRGGMGAVYRARQLKLDRDLALKILLPDLGADPAFAERFTREARALAKLNHPNIVAVYDFGERDGLFYLMMEFVDGVNLRQAMAAGRFTPEQAVAVIPGICDALQAAHGSGILHRDIKPENILLDKDGQVKIADFGIARLVGEAAPEFTLTETGTVLGSRQYMAPEQLEGSRVVDHRADIYSLGVVFYEMLTGELPIGRFRPPSEKTPTTEDIDAVVMRALEKELDRRFQNVQDVKTEVGGATVKRPAAAATAEAAPRREIAGVAQMTLWVLGLVAVGTVWMGLGIVFLGWVPAVCGLMVLLVGYAGCWLGLRAMRRGEISSAGAVWLRFVTNALPSAIVGTLASLWAAHELKDFGKGSVFLTMIAAAVPTYLVAAALAWRSRASIEGYRGRQWAWRGIALLLVVTSLWAASVDGRWPLDHSVARASLKLPQLGKQKLGPAVTKAAGERLSDYQISWRGDWVSLAVLTEARLAFTGKAPLEQLIKNLSSRIQPRGENETPHGHILALKQRLLDALPAAAIVGAELEWMPVHKATGEMLIGFGLLAALAALVMGLGMMGALMGVVGICAMVFAYFTMLFVPAQPYPEDGLQLVTGVAMRELEPEPIEVDFSTPEAAARTYVEAMERADADVIKQAVTPAEWERMTQGEELSEGSVVKGFEGGRVLGVERYSAQLRNGGVGMTVHLVSRDGKQRPVFQGWFSKIRDAWAFNPNP